MGFCCCSCSCSCSCSFSCCHGCWCYCCCCCCCCCCCYVFWEPCAWKCAICDEMLRHVTMSFNLGSCHAGPRHIRGFPVRRDAKWGHMRLGGGEASPEQCMRGPIHGAPLRR